MRRRQTQRGNAFLEFSVVAIFLLSTLTGMVGVGMLLSRAVQTQQVARDAGHMFARSVDFSVSSNQNIVVRLAQGLGMTLTGGPGEVILTDVMFIDPTQCSGCANVNTSVIIKRIVIGNSGLHASKYGSPPMNLANVDGSFDNADYLNNTSFRVPANAKLPDAMTGGDEAYVSEAFFDMSDLALPFFNAPGKTYAYCIF